MKFTKQPSILFIGLLMILGVSANAPAEEASEREEAKKFVIEYRDGTRQTLILDKEWWHILNVLLPTTPAPLREDKQGQPAAKGPPAPKIKDVILDVSGKWINWRQGEKQIHTMRLIQEGRRVRGLHRLDANFVIDGTIEGNVLRGTWSSPETVGEFLFEFSEDGRSFRGRWNTTDDLNHWKSGWNGRRQ